MAGTMLTYLDSYCERGGAVGMFAEPLNLYTNLFFVLAAAVSVFQLMRSRSAKGSRFDLWLLVLFLFTIGIGSALWHAFPSGTTVLMDVIPITLFINAYIISALRRLFYLSWAKTGMWWVIYFIAGLAAQKFLPADMLNGTIMYIPTYLTLIIMTIGLHCRDRNAGSIFGLALGAWTVSLIFRTLDMQLCHNVDMGTHFLWHTVNAWVLWRLLKLLIDDSARPLHPK